MKKKIKGRADSFSNADKSVLYLIFLFCVCVFQVFAFSWRKFEALTIPDRFLGDSMVLSYYLRWAAFRYCASYARFSRAKDELVLWFVVRFLRVYIRYF